MIGAHDFDLQRDLAAAQREADAAEATTARARARRTTGARRERRQRRLRIVGVGAALLALLAWHLLRVEGPSEAELRHGPRVVLLLAAEWTDHYMRHNGRPPVKLAEDLPLAADVQVQPESGGVRLSIRDAHGVEHATFVPASAWP